MPESEYGNVFLSLDGLGKMKNNFHRQILQSEHISTAFTALSYTHTR